jgi:hypothetical protein
MDRYEGPQTTLSIALFGGFYIALIMDHYTLTIHLLQVSI